MAVIARPLSPHLLGGNHPHYQASGLLPASWCSSQQQHLHHTHIHAISVCLQRGIFDVFDEGHFFRFGFIYLFFGHFQHIYKQMPVFLPVLLKAARASLAFLMCRQRADVIDPGPSEFIRRSSPSRAASLFMLLRPPWPASFFLSLFRSLCLPSSFILHALFFYYSFTAALSPAFWWG